ncbi:CapA family protein [Alistipes sp.]|uniref:CapA family protein n=1 Tax=Alistipes sp. TaxID=1872444 RepID=UPI003AF03D8B
MRPVVRYALAAVLAGAACALPFRLHREASPSRPAPVRVRLLFAGDVMQHMPQVEAARRGDGFDYSEVFAALEPRFAAADLVVVNLETTLTRSGRYTGYPCFRSPAALAGAMRLAGIDAAVMANNHCCDGGAEGVRTTAAELDACGIRRTGVFTDSLDRERNNPLLFVRRGVVIALLNYTYSTNGMPVPEGVTVNRIDTAAMAADIAAARARGAECVAVCIHWGDEYARRENARQRALARLLRQAGADLIVGSHPHVIQPFEADSLHAVFYSLGNFVSNQRRRYCDGGLLAEITLTRRPDGTLRYAAEAVPVWVALPDYRVLPPEAADTLRLPPQYRQFFTDTEELTGRFYK